MKKIFKDTVRNTEVRVYESPMEFVADGCAGGQRAGWLTTYSDRSNGTWMTDRAGSWAEYARVFPTAYPEGREYLDQMAAELNLDVAAPERIARRQRWNDEDGEVSLDRAFAGEEDVFRAPLRAGRRVKTKNVAVVYNCTVSAGMNVKDAWKVGAGVAVAIDKLEASGFSVEAWVIWGITNPYGTNVASFVACRMKDCGEPLSTDILAGMFCPDFTRAACHGIVSHGGPVAVRSQGLGRIAPPDKRLYEHMGILENVTVIEAACQKDFLLVDAAGQARRIIKEATEA